MSAKARYDHLMTLYRTGQYEAASKGITTALRIAPQDPHFLHLAGLIAEAEGESPRGIMLMRRALIVRPGWVDAEYNLARLLASNGDYADAIALMKHVAESQPGMPQAFEALADFSTRAKAIPDAIAYWEKALTLVPQQEEWRGRKILLQAQICDWKSDRASLSNLPPQVVVTQTDDPALQKASAIRTAQARFGEIQPLPPASWPKHKKLRIGYLSSDFHAHATAYLLAELFSLHDKERFEVYAYSYGADDHSEMRLRLKKEAEHFVDIRKKTPQAAAQAIRDDEIDILVDLKGYTRGSRLEILARRPAPHQIHWLGYPGTLGCPFIEAFVADSTTIPPQNEGQFTEKVLRLPHCYQINDRLRPIAPTKDRAAYGLPNDALVIGSFNQTYKITPELFDIWCSVLRDVPNSVLWLFESNLFASPNLRNEAKARGIDPARLIFAEPVSHSEHLARYASMDFAIDTFPVGGHTTTSDALWAGTPVVTMMGQSFVSRVASSVLRAAGLGELITTTPTAYRDLIIAMAQNPSRVRQLKRHLQANRSTLPLFDTPRFVKDWEFVLAQLAMSPPQS